MSSPATFTRTFNDMSASSPIDLTRTPRTPDIIIINSESEDEINEPSYNRNNSNYHFYDNNNSNNTLGFDNQIIFNSLRHSSNNIQDSSSSNTNYNRLGTNGSSPNRNRNRPRVNLIELNFAYHPYASTEVVVTSNYGNGNSSGSSRSTLFDSTRANTNINSNDVQMLRTPPRRRNNNSPKPTTLSSHARDLNEFHTLICAECDELLHEKLWALSSCGHVVCGSCVDKYKYSEKKKFPCPSCKKIVNPKNILPLFV